VILSLIVVNGGFGAAQKLKAGEKHRDTIFWIPLAYPWSGEVAKLSWARGSGGPLPSCALYLGQANGISVFYDAEHKRTWRIPSSDLVVTSEPSADRCP